MPDFTNKEKYVIDKVINRTTTAEGSQVPPRQIGTDRVPVVTNVQLVSSILNGDGSTTFTLTFNEPINPVLPIDHYNIIINSPSTSVIQSVVVAKKSPAIFKFFGPANSVLNLQIQTALKNGMTSSLS